jgi:hypothetical protein
LIPGRGKIFLLSTMSRLALEPTQPLIQWIPGALSLRVKWQVLNLITHLYLVPRSRMVELYLHSLICLHGIVLD